MKNSLSAIKIAGFALVFVPIVLLFVYVLPVYDDYWYANIVMKNGMGDAQSWWYNNCQGRYFSNFVISFDIVLCKSLVLYRTFIFLLFSLMSYSVYRLVKAFIQYFIKDADSIVFVLFFILISFFLQCVPGMSEFIYWLPGVATYSLGIVAVNFLIIWLFFKKDKKPIVRNAAIIVTAILGCGTSELAVVAVLTVFSVYFILRILHTKSVLPVLKTTDLLLFCIVFLVAYFVVLKCPGSHSRMAREKGANEHAGEIMFAVKYGSKGLVKFLYNIVFARQGILVFFLALITSSFIKKDNVTTIEKANFIKLWLFFEIILICYTAFSGFICAYSTGVTVMIPRTLCFLFFLWCANLVLSAFLFTIYFDIHINLSTANAGFLKMVMAAIFCNILFFSNISNIRAIYTDFHAGRIKAYNTYFSNQRNDFMNYRTVGADTTVIAPKSVIYVWDLSEEHFHSRYLPYYQEYLCPSPGAQQQLSK